MFDWFRHLNDKVNFEMFKSYAQNLRHFLSLYPEDRRKIVKENYMRHGAAVFRLFAEARKKK